MTVIDVRERQSDRAWREHRGDRVPVEAWRAARAFKRSIAGLTNISEELNDTITVKRMVRDFTCKKGLGRQRALAKLKEKFAGAEFMTLRDCFELRWCEPRADSLIRDPREPGEEQPCTVALFAVAGPTAASRRSSCMLASISLEVPDHCLARMFQRSPDVDPRVVITAAGVAFMQSDFLIGFLLNAAWGLSWALLLLVFDRLRRPRAIAR